MKKLILILLISLFSLDTYSQNMVGYSWSDVYKLMDESGYIVTKGRTKADVPYILARNSGISRGYYFTENNLCFLYIYFVDGATYLDISKALIDDGYVRVDEKFYKGKFIAQIDWNKDMSGYVCTILLNTEKEEKFNHN